MKVRIVGLTQPVIPECSTAAELLAFCARVSSTANQLKHETGGRLLRSLVKRREWSPFEMVTATIEIETTRDIARQILRHRSLAFQEFSQRYAEVVDEPVFREARTPHPTDRQASIGGAPDWLREKWLWMQADLAARAREVYEAALRDGIAKEVARAVLPEGLTTSRLYAAGTLRSWIHYVEARTYAGTQKEHREIAGAVADALMAAFPDLSDVFHRHDIEPEAAA